jgi:hypothetical protein
VPTEPPEDSLSYLSDAENKLLNQFLVLIRDNYKKTDKATFYMERRAGVINTCAIYNLRDVLSHFATFLDSRTPAEKRPDQLAGAEEHLRRAIIEPYEIGIASLTEKFEPLYEKYKARLVPVKDRYVALGSAPSTVQVDAEVSEINDLVQRGKNAKGNNRWDSEWEAGMGGLPVAFDKLATLCSKLEGYWDRYEQMRRDKWQTVLTIWSIVATVLALILGVVEYLRGVH